MKFATFTTLLAAASFGSAASIKRQTVQADFDNETIDLKNRGLCRVFKGGRGAHDVSLGLCEAYCEPAKALAIEENGFSSYACSATQATDLPYFPDPNGDEYTLGKCECNLPAVTLVGHVMVVTLPQLGLVTCAVWKVAAEEAGKLLAGVLGGARADTGAQTLWKIFNTLRKGGQSTSEWEEYVNEHLEDPSKCGIDAQELAKAWEKIPPSFYDDVRF